VPIILFSIYLGFLLTKVAPFSSPISDLGMFFIYALLVFLFLNQAKIFRSSSARTSVDKGTKIWYFILTLCLLTAIIADVSAGQTLVDLLPGLLRFVFISSFSVFAWVGISLIALVPLAARSKGKKKKKKKK